MTKRNFTWWHNTFAKLTPQHQHTFQILLAPCNDPGFPANGNGQWRDLKHNSWIKFSCNKKYQLEGSRQIQCKDGIWSDNRPICVGKKIRIRCSFEKISERYQLFCFHLSFICRSPPKYGCGVTHCRYIVTTPCYTVLVFKVLLLSFLIFETFRFVLYLFY